MRENLRFAVFLQKHAECRLAQKLLPDTAPPNRALAVMPLEPAPVCLSFKCSPEEFAEMVERPGIIPAPHMARAFWVALQNENAWPRQEIRER